MVLPTARVVGRRDAQDAIVSVVDAVAAGRGGVVVVEADAGLGKSFLLSELKARARDARVAVRSATAHGIDTVGTLSPLAAALGVRQRSGRAAGDAARDVLAGGALGGTAADLVDACVDAFDTMTTRGPLVLAIDDFHWAARPDVAVASALARRAPMLPCSLVVALQPEPRSRECAAFVDAIRRDGARDVLLPPLDDGDALRLFSSFVDGAPDLVVRDAVRRMGGNPFYLRALAASLPYDGATAAGPHDVVQRNLAALEPDVADLLAGAAVLGDVVSVLELAALHNERAAAVVPVVERAQHAGVLRRNRDHVRFTHDIVRKAVYRDLDATRRRTLHEDAARALRDQGAAPERIAWHLAAAAGSDDPTAARRLTRTARAAIDAAPAAAAILGRRAVAVAPDDDPDARAVLVDALARCGRADDALVAARAATATNIALRVAHAYAALQSARPIDPSAAAAIGAAVNAGGNERSALLAHVAVARVVQHDLVGADDFAGRAVATDGAVAVHALGARAWVASARGDIDDALTRAGAAVDASDPGTPSQALAHYFRATVLLDADRLDDAACAFTTGVDGADRWLVALHRQGAGAAAFLAGDWDRAAVDLETGAAQAEEIGSFTAVAPSHALLALVALARADIERARRHLARADDALARGTATLRPEWVALARALVAEHDGAAADARAALADAWDAALATESTTDVPTIGPELGRLVVVDEPERARAVVARLERLAAGSPLERVRAAADRARALLDTDVDVAMGAVAAYGRAPRPYERARATLDAMEVCARAGHPNLARDCFEDAANELARLGAVGDLRAGATRARALGLRVQLPPVADAHGWPSLTAVERDVATLAARGASNRQVADELDLPVRDVECHLRHVYAKLRVHGRAELATRVPSP